MKFSTNEYSGVQILNSTTVLFFFNSVPEIPFWDKFASETSNALFETKLITKAYSRVVIPNLTIVSLKFFFWASLALKLQTALF